MGKNVYKLNVIPQHGEGNSKYHGLNVSTMIAAAPTTAAAARQPMIVATVMPTATSSNKIEQNQQKTTYCIHSHTHTHTVRDPLTRNVKSNKNPLVK